MRCLYKKEKFNCVCNRFGIPTVSRPKGKLIWIHAASIGESTSALTLIQHIKKRFPNSNILITTITVTSANILLPKISLIDKCLHQFSVADNPIWVNKFLDYWKPNISFFVESEIWPNTIDSLFQRKIPVFLLNARLSTKSFNRWRIIKGFFSETLKKFTAILAQSKVDAERYAFFFSGNVKIIDNLKYANAQLPCNEDLLQMFQKICEGRKILVAASTHEGEEEIILEAHKKLRNHIKLVTIIIPRHLTRIKKNCEIFRDYQLNYSLRSAANISSTDVEIFCVDTFGEVGTFYRLADICFVGGSLVPVGGHNIFEPVALGKPVLHGPYMDNALEVRDFLKSKGLAFEVNGADKIRDMFLQLTSDSQELNRISSLALSLTKNNSLNQIDKIVQWPRLMEESTQ
ncbi:MAG: 3-deoxy-D-manno-octulosonic acid transferase [Holosporaceae bacterium]|jgi:3-deoxy-D-manno-octulosonic-acid transferase|nr:3-deoxy-D-manno-octulosonic acid transferase [Holosporaceae bacterium]